MPGPEDLILKRLQTNIAQHEGRIKEAEAEGGANARIMQNVLLEGELMDEAFDSINKNIVEPIKTYKQKQEDFKEWSESPYEQQKADLLFGRKTADDFLRDRMFGRDPYRLGIGKLDKDYAGEALSVMNDKDLQTVYRSGMLGVWIDETNGDYKAEPLANQNNLSDDALKVLVKEKVLTDDSTIATAAGVTNFINPNDTTFEVKPPPVDEHEGPADDENQGPDKYSDASRDSVVDSTRTLNELIQTYGKNTPKWYEKSGIQYKNMWQRFKIGSIKKAVKNIQEGQSVGHWKGYLKKNAPDIYQHMYRNEGEE